MSNKQKAYADIAKLTDQAIGLVRQAEQIADEACVEFNFDVAYGMGGTYVPAGLAKEYSYYEGAGWQSSSSGC